MPGHDERALLQRVAARDRKAFEALYHLYYRRLFGYVFKLTRRPELVEEVVNDVLLAVWQGAARFDGRSRPSTWVFGIAYHKALKALARAGGRPAAGEDERAAPEPVDTEGPESLMARRELQSTLGRALATLSPEQRAVVELTYVYGCSYQEISDVIGCPVNTVKTRMFHARRKLRELLPALGIGSHAG
ncbi:MAG TPA: sigma-70 family RNA polymerase sigma factor [Thermoanaerobaculia bacterium]|nr:sigma-70 family RNA polymerase sigma factor [Thermoanaerobaculia bacterium]